MIGSPHAHGHSHSHGQSHSHGGSQSERRVFWALLLTGGFMIVEVVGGLISGSLALLADAGHMATDTAALAFAWIAIRLASLPADTRRSYGYHRLQVIAAFVNGIALIVISVWIVVEAIGRLLDPPEVLGGLMMAVAAAGLCVNLAALGLLLGANRANLNIRGAFLHVLGDLLGSVAALSAAAVILFTGWMPIDPLLSFAVVLLIVRSAWSLVRKSGHILMEGAPDGFDPKHLKRILMEPVPVVEGVHHVHAWSLTPERPLISMHVRIASGDDYDQALKDIQDALATQLDIGHATIQLEGAWSAETRDAATSLPTFPFHP